MHEKHFKLPPTQRVIEQNILLYFISLPMQELLVSYEVSFYVNFPAVFFLLEKPYKINHSLCLINYWSGSSCLLQFSVILKVLFCSVEESYFKSLSGDKGVHTKFQVNACGNTYGNLNATSVHWHFMFFWWLLKSEGNIPRFLHPWFLSVIFDSSSLTEEFILLS